MSSQTKSWKYNISKQSTRACTKDIYISIYRYRGTHEELLILLKLWFILKHHGLRLRQAKSRTWSYQNTLLPHIKKVSLNLRLPINIQHNPTKNPTHTIQTYFYHLNSACLFKAVYVFLWMWLKIFKTCSALRSIQQHSHEGKLYWQLLPA